jgi:hypothetical protein
MHDIENGVLIVRATMRLLGALPSALHEMPNQGATMRRRLIVSTNSSAQVCCDLACDNKYLTDLPGALKRWQKSLKH